MILKYYNTNKKLSNKPTYISIEKHFGTDNYLIQTDELCQTKKKYKENLNFLSELDDSIKQMKDEYYLDISVEISKRQKIIRL